MNDKLKLFTLTKYIYLYNANVKIIVFSRVPEFLELIFIFILSTTPNLMALVESGKGKCLSII